MRKLPLLLCLFIVVTRTAAAENKTTCYRDGTVRQLELQAVKGFTSAPLAAGLLEQTLTVTPAPGTKIISVTTINPGAGAGGKEFEALTEQRRRLEDRLQALETREAIFTAAAKAQSGKAPRKTKANPDPLQAIRQGTDFAIAQLEAVYTARRRTNQEIRKIDMHLAALRTGGQSKSAQMMRIAVTPPNGRVTLRYATPDQCWLPGYRMNLTGDGFADLQLSAESAPDRQRETLMVSTGSLADTTPPLFPLTSGNAVLTNYRLPISNVRSEGGIFNRFSAVITNSSSHYLPPGETGLFNNGIYLGKFRFEGLSSGRSKAVSLGR